MLQKDRLAKDDSVVEGPFDLEDHLLLCDGLMGQRRDGNVDVLAIERKEHCFQQHFLQFLLGRGSALHKGGFVVDCAVNLFVDVFLDDCVND